VNQASKQAESKFVFHFSREFFWRLWNYNLQPFIHIFIVKIIYL
jgi:hypothetical protein